MQARHLDRILAYHHTPQACLILSRHVYDSSCNTILLNTVPSDYMLLTTLNL